MNYTSIIILRICLIIIAILSGVVLYYKIVEPFILKPLCLSDSNSCLRLAYWNYNNSLLFHMEPIGYWVWFNGTQAFVFNVINGAVCPKGDDGTVYSPAFPLDPVPNAKPTKWECIENIDSLINLYENKFGVKKKFLWKRINPKLTINPKTVDTKSDIKGPVSLSVYDILNIFADRNIINLQNI